MATNTEEESVSTSPPSKGNSHIVSFERDSSWTKFTKEELIDRIKGLVYGQAIGDAIGLSTEFLSKKQAVSVYGPKGPSSYKDIIDDGHRMRWSKGDWTDDTDQMLLILLSIVDNDGQVDEKDFASRLHNWMLNGFSELGDRGGLGIGMTVGRVLRHSDLKTDPHGVARKVWESSGRYLAANGAVMRTSILGVLNFNDIPKVIENTRKLSLVTHADPRCTASCIAVTTAIAMMLQGQLKDKEDKEVKILVEEALKHADAVIELKDQKKEMRQHVFAKNLKDLKLDDAAKIGYTFKTMGCGFYGLLKGRDFKTTIMEVVMEAGDADTNAAVCGAMLGCKLGYSALPDDLLQFPHRQWLDTQVESFLKTIGLA